MKNLKGKVRKKNNRKEGSGRKYSHSQFIDGKTIIHYNYGR